MEWRLKIEELQESAPSIFKPLDTTTIAIQRVGNKKKHRWCGNNVAAQCDLDSSGGGIMSQRIWNKKNPPYGGIMFVSLQTNGFQIEGG